jgi:pSer/pThr/pTyr-binding forkhead associated (FHA) protein
MSDDKNSGAVMKTQLDRKLARPRLKEGLVPEDTGIWLSIEEGVDAGHKETLSPGGVYTIGREGADIALEDGKVSRKHAEIGLYGPGAYMLRDLASTNGTLLNGKRVGDRAKLSNGDVVRVGDTMIRIDIIEGSLPISE